MTVDVTWLDLDVLGPALIEAERRIPRLSAAELERHQRFGRAGAAARYFASHVALRLVLEQHAGRCVRRVPFSVGPKGKPELPGAGVAFSLSHAGNYAAIAIAPAGPLGIDIELPRKLGFDERRRALLIAAASSIGPPLNVPGLDANAIGLMAWTRLEALAKATGEGIGSVLSHAFGRSGDKEQLGKILTAASLRIVDLASGGVLRAPAGPAAQKTAIEVAMYAALALPANASFQIGMADIRLAGLGS